MIVWLCAIMIMHYHMATVHVALMRDPIIVVVHVKWSSNNEIWLKLRFWDKIIKEGEIE